MSLHLGNLSSHIRRDDLERVFRRFGRCTIQVKDRYGFVVFDYPASAEKALKALQGKRICRETITLSWSNRQPRALRRFSRGGNLSDPQSRRHSVRVNVNHRMSSNNQKDHKMNYKQENGQVRKLESSELVDDSTTYPDDSKGCVRKRKHTSSNDRLEVGVRNFEDDEWMEQVLDASIENCLKNDMEFDRYEPCQSDGKKEQEGDQQVSPLGSSHSTRKSQERIGTVHNAHQEASNYPFYSKSQKICYKCREVGHKMNKCPLKVIRSGSRRRLNPGSDIAPMRIHESKMVPSLSRNHRRWRRRGDCSPPSIIPKHTDKKRNRKDNGNFDKCHSEKVRGLMPSSIHYDYTSFRSQSRSIRSLSQSPTHSNSKSMLSKKNSRPSPFWFSTSCHSGSKAPKSRSTSSSMSPASSSLPVEFDLPLSSSKNNRETHSKGSMVNAPGLVRSKESYEKKQPVRSIVGAFDPENSTSVMENECEAMPSKMEKEEMKKDFLERNDALFDSASRGSYAVLESNVPKLDNGDNSAEYLLLHSVNDMKNSQSKDLVGEGILTPDSYVSTRSNAASSLRMSSEEIYMALKHYGLQYPEENEKATPVETFFGSARTWPWEIIYYRRLKKGPISAENYAHRIAQNKEFGILDKYIRGSSGWGESSKDNP